MEFNITKDKNAERNQMLLLWIKYRKCTHHAWFLLSIWPISSFWGFFEVLNSIVSLGRLWLNKIGKSSISLSLYVQRCSSLRFHIYNTSAVSTYNEGNIAVNRNSFSTTVAKHKTNIWKFLLLYKLLFRSNFLFLLFDFSPTH